MQIGPWTTETFLCSSDTGAGSGEGDIDHEEDIPKPKEDVTVSNEKPTNDEQLSK